MTPLNPGSGDVSLVPLTPDQVGEVVDLMNRADDRPGPSGRNRRAPWAALGREMHYRTPRVGFFDPPDGFLDLMDEVHRLDGTSFETDELPDAEGRLTVMPAAP